MIASSAAADSPVVIVAEDELLTRMAAAEVLSEAGFLVLEAEHAQDALAILSAKASDIHILFTDVDMPGAMNGIQLAHHANSHWPWIGLLVASGKARLHPAQLPAGSRFLMKPYEFLHMLSHVHELTARVLSRPPPAARPS